MKTPGPTAGTSAPTAAPGPSAWRVGQIVQARVTAVAANRITLLAGGRELVTQTPAPLRVGDTIALEVRRLGDPPVLRVLPPAERPAQTDALAAGVRQLLPRQAPLAALLSALLTVAQAPPPPLAPTVVNAVRALLRQLGDAAALTRPGDLRKAVEDAATALESKLLQRAEGGAAVTGDLRAALLKLIAVLQAQVGTTTGTAAENADADVATPTLGGLAWPRAGSPPTAQSSARFDPALLRALADTETALLPRALATLARLELNQLAALSRDPRGAQAEWLIELPVRRDQEIDVWSLRLFRDRDDRNRRPAETSRAWVVQLAFDLPGLGPVQAQVRWADERVSAGFWAEREATVPLIERRLHELEAGLRAEGLDVASVVCHRGTLPAPAAAADGLLDEHA